MLKINEIYKSIQGESSFSGLPCTFVRLTGCHLRCTWCDTAYAFYDGEEMNVDQVVDRVQKLGVPLVELTGGEPLLQEDAFLLVKRLIDLNFQVLIETSGAVSLKGLDTRSIKVVDIKCPGSGMSEKMIWENLKYLSEQDEVKFVILNRQDFDWACQMVQQHELFKKCSVLFSPVFRKLNPQQLTQWILETQLPVRLQLQIHKYIWDPATRGV